MSTLRRAMGNSSILMVSQLITWVASLVLMAALGRHLGDTGFGHLYLAMTYATIFGVLVDFGLDRQLVRDVARNRSLAAPYLVNAMAIKASLSAIAYFAILAIIDLLRYPPEVKTAIIVINVVLLFSGLSSSLTALYQAFENVFQSAVATIVEKVFISAVSLFLLTRGYGVITMGVVFVVGTAVGTAWKAFYIRKMVRVEAAPNLQMMRTLLRLALPVFIYRALGSVYYRIDIVLLSILASPMVVGWYGAAYRLFDTLVFLPGIVSGAIMLPVLSRLSVKPRAELQMALGKGLDVMLIVGVPICTGLFALAQPIVSFIYGKPEFLNAVPALRWLSLALLCLYVNSVLGAALFSLNQERKMTAVAGLAIAVNLGLNWVLIPNYGHLAAAAVTAVTELSILCCWLLLIPKDLLSRSSLKVAAKAMTAGLAMCLVLYVLRGNHLLVLVPAGGLTYCLTGLLLRLVPPEDMRLLKQAIMTRRSSQAVLTEGL